MSMSVCQDLRVYVYVNFKVTTFCLFPPLKLNIVFQSLMVVYVVVSLLVCLRVLGKCTCVCVERMFVM